MAFLGVVCDEKTREAVEAAAEDEGRSLSSWCRRAIEAALRKKK